MGHTSNTFKKIGRIGARIRPAIPGTRPVLAILALILLVGCGPTFADYGANFNYPSGPAVPVGATTLVSDKGWDDDFPIRLRVKVLDLGKSSMASLVDFYRKAYPSADGSAQLKVDRRNQELCLVRHTDKGYTEFVEVFRYTGVRVTPAPSRYLVSVSRLKNLERGGDARSCTMALGWIPSDLF